MKSKGIKPIEYTRGLSMSLFAIELSKFLYFHSHLICFHFYQKQNAVKEKLNEDADCEIATTMLRVSLMCPLGKMRMTTPCRLVYHYLLKFRFLSAYIRKANDGHKLFTIFHLFLNNLYTQY